MQIPENFFIQRQQNGIFTQSGQLFNSLTVNLTDITEGVIQDAIVSQEEDAIIIYLLVCKSLATNDISGSVLTYIEKSVQKFRLNKLNIKKVLGGKSLSSEHEQIFQIHHEIYNFAKENARQILLPFDEDKIFVFVCDECLILMSKSFYFFIISSGKISKELEQGNFDESHIYKLSSVNTRFKDVKILRRGLKVLFEFSGVTLCLMEIENKFTLLCFEIDSPIYDVDLMSGKIALDNEIGDLTQINFELSAFEAVVVKNSNIGYQIFKSSIVADETHQDFIHNSKLHLMISEEDRTLFVRGDLLQVFDLKANPVFVQQTLPNDRELRIFNLSSPVLSYIAVTAENQIFEFDITNFALGKNLFKEEVFSNIIEVKDNFFEGENFLILDERSIRIIEKHTSVTSCSVTLESLPKKLLTIKNLAFLLNTSGVLNVFVFNEGSLLETPISSDTEFKNISDMCVFGSQLFLLHSNNSLEIFIFDNKEFTKTLVFQLTDACNVISNIHAGIEEENFKNHTCSVTNLSVKIPKRGRTEFNKIVCLDFFQFSWQHYLVLVFIDGSVVFYKMINSTLVRVGVDHRLKAHSFGLADSGITSIIGESHCIISLYKNITLLMKIENSKEKIEALFEKSYESIFIVDGRIMGFIGQEVDIYNFRPISFKCSLVNSSRDPIKTAYFFKSFKVRNSQISANLIIIHRQSHQISHVQSEKLEIFDEWGRFLNELVFNENESVTLVKQLFYEDNSEQELFIGYTVSSSSSSELTSKWKFLDIQLVGNNFEQGFKCEISVLLDQTCQEKGRQIKQVFTISRNAFICLDDKILQIEHGKIKKIYEVNLQNISHVAVKSNYVLLGDQIDRILFSVWSPEKRELFERSSCNTECTIKDIFFLNDQSVRVI
jgi:hypothetical protein